MRAFPTLLTIPALLSSQSLFARQAGLYDESAIRTLEVTAPANWWTQLTMNYASKTYIKVALKVDGVTYKDVGFRFRGNSSYKAVTWTQKKPFKLSMDKFVPGQRLYGFRTINLNNSFRDPTHTREIVSYWMWRHYMPAPRANYVKLYINKQYWGLYQNVEQINKDLLGAWFQDVDGNRYRGERQSFTSPVQNTGLLWLGPSAFPYQQAYQIKNENPVNPWTDLIGVCNVLNNSGTRLRDELAKVLDVDESIRYLALSNLLPAMDSYIGNAPHNFYLYQDKHHGRMSILPWDMNAAFGGNNWMTVQQKETLDIWFKANELQRPLLNKMLAVPEWRARYVAHYRTMLDGRYNWQTLGTRILWYQKLIEKDLQADSNKLYSMQEFRDNVTKNVNARVGSFRYWIIPGMKPFIEARESFLRNHFDLKKPFPVVSELANNPAIPSRNQKVTVTARVSKTPQVAKATLYYRIKGRFLAVAMFDDGLHGDGKAGDGVWGADIPGQAWGTRVEYYVEAWASQSAGGTMRFAPALAEHRPARYRVTKPNGGPRIRINELLAKNVTGIKDENGQREDWIELFNAGTGSVSLAGMYLTDDLNFPMLWRFPPGTGLAAGQTLLVWADNDPKQGPLHATFKLDRDGEEIALFDTDGNTLVDFFRFGPQMDDIATGRYFDGQDLWVTLLRPTPNARNSSAACGAKIYSALDPRAHRIIFVSSSTPKPGAPVLLELAAGVPNSVAVVFLGAGPSQLPFLLPQLRLLVQAPPLHFVAPTDPSGKGVLALGIPADPRFVGARLNFQAFMKSPDSFLASNGVELRVCPK